MAIGGALATLVLNMLFIPYFSFVASAWITLIVYAAMVIASWYMGRSWYPVPYHYGNGLMALVLAGLAWLAFSSTGLTSTDGSMYWLVGSTIVLVYGGIAFLSEKKQWLWKSSE